MTSQATSPGRLAVQLAIYFAVTLGVMIVLVETRPELLRYLPLGGIDALSGADVTEVQDIASDDAAERQPAQRKLISAEDTADYANLVLWMIDC